jgi:hypothetical protein
MSSSTLVDSVFRILAALQTEPYNNDNSLFPNRQDSSVHDSFTASNSYAQTQRGSQTARGAKNHCPH